MRRASSSPSPDEWLPMRSTTPTTAIDSVSALHAVTSKPLVTRDTDATGLDLVVTALSLEACKQDCEHKVGTMCSVHILPADPDHGTAHFRELVKVQTRACEAE